LQTSENDSVPCRVQAIVRLRLALGKGRIQQSTCETSFEKLVFPGKSRR